VRIWGVGDHGLPRLASFTNPGLEVASLAVGHDHNLTALYFNGEVREWPDYGADADLICAKLPGDISAADWRSWVSTDLPPKTLCGKK
jgi:hypothetical protein